MKYITAEQNIQAMREMKESTTKPNLCFHRREVLSFVIGCGCRCELDEGHLGEHSYMTHEFSHLDNK